MPMVRLFYMQVHCYSAAIKWKCSRSFAVSDISQIGGKWALDLHFTLLLIPFSMQICLHCSIFSTAPTLPGSGSVFAAYTADTLKLYCLYTPRRSGYILYFHLRIFLALFCRTIYNSGADNGKIMSKMAEIVKLCMMIAFYIFCHFSSDIIRLDVICLAITLPGDLGTSQNHTVREKTTLWIHPWKND